MTILNRLIKPLFVFVFSVVSLVLQYLSNGLEWIALWGMLILIVLIIVKLIYQLLKRTKNQYQKTLSNNLICLMIIISFFLIVTRFLGISLFIKLNNKTDNRIDNIKLVYVGDNIGTSMFTPIDKPINVLDLDNLENGKSKWIRIDKSKYSSFIIKIISGDSTSNILDFNYTFRPSPRFNEVIIEQNKDGVIIAKVKKSP